jgi:acetyl esterase/lipase
MKPRLAEALTTLGLGDKAVQTLDIDDLVAVEALVSSVNDGFQSLYNNLPNVLPTDKLEQPVEETAISIPGRDGNGIQLHIFSLTTRKSKTPAVVYLHGGAMCILDARNKVHTRWCMSLAREGVLVIMVDFRNAWSADGTHRPFPKGLEDCAEGIKYVHQYRDELGISGVVVQGESGGGNLALASALLAKKEGSFLVSTSCGKELTHSSGWLEALDGVSAQDPFICGDLKVPADLKSRVELDGYLLSAGNIAAMV